MSDIPLICNAVRRDIEVPAATPTTIDIPIDHALHWTVTVKNTGANPVTGFAVSVSALGSIFDELTTVTDGIPLAAGDSLAAIRGEAEPVKTLRLVVTSTLGTTVSYEAAGR